MEDALAHTGMIKKKSGRRVLILVLMEDALAQFSRLFSIIKNIVLILVLMEDALAPTIFRVLETYL